MASLLRFPDPAPLYDPAARRTRYETLRGALWTERQSGFDTHWRELGDFLMPRRTRFWVSDRNRGDKRNQNIIDSTGRFSARTLASGLQAGLTSPARPWMKLSTPDPDLAAFGPVREWLHVVTERMLTIFSVTNLYNVLPLVYLDMGIFGTAAMSVLEDTKDLFRCYSYPIGSWAIGQDARGLATTFVRDYELTVRQVVEQFAVDPDDRRTIDWRNISTTVRDLWHRGDYEAPIPVTWLVKPNDYATPRAGRPVPARDKPWTSCYWETGSNAPQFLRESGFDTYPLLCPRWDITGEDSYGTDCPGMTALGDVKQLQIMQRRKAQLLNKAVDPPLKGPPSLRMQPITLLPGDITYVDAREGLLGLSPIHEVRLEGFQHLTGDIREVQYRIQRAFYEDLFLMITRSDDRLGADRPTAREIDERHEEKLLALGPVLERTNDELLDPLIDRVYALMFARRLIPEPPPDLLGVELKVEYLSILSQAQKLVGVSAQDRFLMQIGGLAQFQPDVLAKVKFAQVVDNYADMLGVDPRIVRATDEADAMVAAQRQQAAQAAQAEQAATLAKAAKDASQAPVTGDTVLTRMAAAAGGAGPAAA